MAKTKFRPTKAGLILGCITAICLYAIMQVESTTKNTIENNRSAKVNAMINNLLPAKAVAQKDRLVCRYVSDKRIGQKMKLYTAYQGQEILGYILSYKTARGYSNPLIYIGGFTPDFKVNRIDIELSRETPGIGDKIDRKHGDYLDAFNGHNLASANWDVKKFGGEFDYFTGATITSRSAVLATKDALEVLQQLDLDTLPLCEE